MGDTVPNQSSGVGVNATNVNIGGDVAGRDIVKQTVEAPKPIVIALHQLPTPPADFTGREADLDAILKDIQGGAVISGVRGMGGIGKTARAISQ